VGYYMRFVSTDAAPIAGQQLGDAVAATSRQYKVQADDSAVLNRADAERAAAAISNGCRR